ncbi:MAG: LOG family protein [Propionicimonas sp.]
MRAELESAAALDQRLASGTGLARTCLQSLDLTGRTPELLAAGIAGAVLLGCTLDPGADQLLVEAGALVFPRLPDLPFNPYRSGLYRPEELYSRLDEGYQRSFDAGVYRWWQHHSRHRDLTAELAMTLHDYSVVDALEDNPVTAPVGVMGGHRSERGSTAYAEAVRLGRELAARGHTVFTGGGPGAMEAAALGAALVGPWSEVEQALELLARHPRFDTDAETSEWARAAFEVRAGHRLTGPSIGIPTWVYGHEPPNAFSGGIAKLFSNAIREDILLRLSTGGLVCLPGAAGTVQEIFQALTPRYYATGGTIPPLILLGIEHWTRQLPAWPLVEALALGREFAGRIHLCDSVDEVLALLG